MTIFNRSFNSNGAIIIAGVILFSYLAVLLSLANIGQQRLAEAQKSEVELRVKQYAESIEGFFTMSEDELSHLAHDQAVAAYFANLASGMSMEYGLSASLYKVGLALDTVQQHKRINGLVKYARIVLVDLNGTVISDTDAERPLLLDQIPLAEFISANQAHTQINLKQHQLIELKLLTMVHRHGKPVGVLIADINSMPLIKRASALEHQHQGSHLSLQTELGAILVWDSLHNAQDIDDDSNLIAEAKVAGTPYSIHGRFMPIGKQDLFTNKGFVAAISLLALPVLLGFFFLWRLNTGKLVLQTKFELSNSQKQKLAQKNQSLLREIAKRRESERQLAYQATHDELTGLPNRQHGQTALSKAIAEAKQDGGQILLMFTDLDNFKRVNDTKGHEVGDELLKSVGQRLLCATRSAEHVVRFGGDEFLLIFTGVQGQSDATALVDRVQALFEQPFKLAHNEFHVSTSIGLALYPNDGGNANALIKNADVALSQVKDGSIGGYRFYDVSLNLQLQRNAVIERRLRHALNNELIEVYYQPVLTLADNCIIGAEALARWHDDELGWVTPNEFIPLAESTGLIHELGRQVFSTAVKQAQTWQINGECRLAVNFSTVQIQRGEQLLEQIKSTLITEGFPPQQLCIEVTESLVLQNDDSIQNVMEQLRHLGCKLSIDDFGTGYSALSYLQQFSFSRLKIDRAFVMNLEQSEADQALVKAMLAMAKALGMTVVAEGVETQWQADFLTQQYCEFGQGYLFSKPVPAAEFEQLLQAQQQVQKTIAG